MLRVILLSLFWAVCSTCLVRPWFWKGVFKKDLYHHDGEKIGFDDDWKFAFFVEIVCFIVVFGVSLLTYLLFGCRQNLWGSFPMIILCLLAQCLWQYQGKGRYIIFLSFAVIFAILWIQDGIVGSNINVPLNKVESVNLSALSVQEDEEDTQVKLFVSADEIASLFKVNSASGPTYNNGKYIFTVSGGDTGDGVVIIDENNYTKADFISCSYKLNVRSIRSKYPTQKLKELYITISDDDVPYGLFVVADKNWFFGTYNFNTYLLIDLTNGEGQELTQEELPSFVTN